jgi:GNAT superfamily N-acetyltransferase
MGASVDEIYYLEELAANGWPAEVVQLVDGWRFRYTPGVGSRRVNSVWPNNSGRFLSLEQKLELVEAFYARHGLPARFQMCPAAQPADLDNILAERDYTVDAPTYVETAEISDILDRPPAHQDTAVSLYTTLPADFSDFQQAQYRLTQEQVAARTAAFNRIGPEAVYGVVNMEGETAGIGMGILERGWLGIFGMMTHPDVRRRGIATAVLRALAIWGQSHGAVQAYLQVMDNNTSAIPLYTRAGFTTQYQYHYRQSN